MFYLILTTPSLASNTGWADLTQSVAIVRLEVSFGAGHACMGLVLSPLVFQDLKNADSLASACVLVRILAWFLRLQRFFDCI